MNKNTDKSADAQVWNSALAKLLYEGLFSPNQEDAEQAARALVISARQHRGEFDVADLKPGDRRREKKMCDALARLLYDAGDRYYSYLTFTQFEEPSDRQGVSRGEATFRISRRLPVMIGNEKVTLPSESDISDAGDPELRILTQPPEVKVTRITQGKEMLLDGDIFVCTFALMLPKSVVAGRIELTFIVPGLLVETHELTVEQMRAEAAI